MMLFSTLNDALFFTCNEAGFITVTDQHTLITACTFELFGDVIVAFLFGKSLQVIIHDNTLLKRFMNAKAKS